ncbi:hypothetical protein ACP70R_006780 [Stipagrostis hirtigluma subsp. patula]
MDGDDAPPLDPSLAPVLLFNCGRGGTGPEEADDGGARLVYSIPKRRLLVAGGLKPFIDDVNWVTPQGWVLTLDPATRAASLRDPYDTSRRVHLPPDAGNLLPSSVASTCVVSTPARRPSEEGSRVVLVIHLNEPVLCYCRPGGSRWFRHEYRPELLVDANGHSHHTIIGRFAKLTAAPGDRFYVVLFNRLVILDFSPDPTFSSDLVAERPLPPAARYFHEAFLLEPCGELFVVRFCYASQRSFLSVEVHKLDRSKGTWAKATGLSSNRVFLITSGQFGASMPADVVGLDANCIYFSNPVDKGLYVYNVEQGTTTLHNPGVDVPDSIEPVLLMPIT